MKKAKRVLIAGVGSILRCDDGLGSYVIYQLRDQKLPGNVETVDLSVSGLSILQHVKGYDKVIFVDAIKKGGKPGSVYRINLHDVAHPSRPINPEEIAVMSMHEVDLEKVISIGKATGEIQSDMIIIGCEPEDTDSLKIGLTNKVKDALPKIIELLFEELEQ